MRYYWKVLFKDVECYIRTCADCQTKKRMITSQQIDLLGPFPKTTQGNKYVITCINYGTKWAEIQAVPAGTAQEVAQFLFGNIICKHSTPGSILTDRGQVFGSAVVHKLLRLMDIQGTMTSGYRSQCNGAVERLHTTLTTMINQRNCDQCFPLVIFAYNISKQESTGFSPFLLVYGLSQEVEGAPEAGYGEPPQTAREGKVAVGPPAQGGRVSAWSGGADTHPVEENGPHSKIHAPLEWSSRGGEKDHPKFVFLKKKDKGAN
ncbi:hypothetical protein PR048_013567 [Dryococelus australis]|uniref:Integrase catalytic domain-containing protein n=1 Tax=Dryococelus australis TaxID=614101 RepID=A0ABQ9HSK0_9NEOP|nr:hypothetical protein PR048_013567 [Dryococelus australis]